MKTKITTTTLFVLMIATIITACKKEETTIKDRYEFVNKTGHNLTVNLYNNYLNYQDQRDIKQTFSVNNGQTVLLDFSAVPDGTTYYIEYYNEDYSFSNWGLTGINNINLVLKSGKNGNHTLIPFQNGPVRKILLDGNKTTKWKAIDAKHQSNPDSSSWASYKQLYNIDSITVICDYVNITFNYHHTNGDLTKFICPALSVMNPTSPLQNGIFLCNMRSQSNFYGTLINTNKYFKVNYSNVFDIPQSNQPSTDTLIFIHNGSPFSMIKFVKQ